MQLEEISCASWHKKRKLSLIHLINDSIFNLIIRIRSMGVSVRRVNHSALVSL